MKLLRKHTLLAFVILQLIAAHIVYGQWTVSSRFFNQNGTDPNHTDAQRGRGAVFISGNSVWVGVNTLIYSEDTGKTWLKSGLHLAGTSRIHDINFFDSLTGAVATSDLGIMKTTDGGATWKQILLSGGLDFWKVHFNGSADIIHATGSDRGVCYTTTNGGTDWHETALGPFVSSMAIAPDHTVYVFSQKNYLVSGRGWINSSTDFGKSWKQDTLALIDGDSYTLSVDSCDAKRLYLLNEDWASSNDNTSEVFISTDAGHKWSAHIPNIVPYYTGALATTSNSLFVSTATEGILRSTDKGETWINIGGPTLDDDSRTIEPMNDNIIFALDEGGVIWMTMNSGGHLVKPIPPQQVSLRLHSIARVSDSIGSIIRLPLYAIAKGEQSGVDFIVHYPSHLLNLLDVKTPSGKRLDDETTSWQGRARVHVDASQMPVAPDSLIGYLDFVWTPLELSCAQVTFDSVSLTDRCLRATLSVSGGSIGNYPSCTTAAVGNVTGLSDVEFRMTPNPASEYATLTSHKYSGPVLLKFIDNLGRMIHTVDGGLSPAEGFKFNLSCIASGAYIVQIIAGKRVALTELIVSH
ncbi:MAG: hypothetical protein WCH46_03745 [bacterium]